MTWKFIQWRRLRSRARVVSVEFAGFQTFDITLCPPAPERRAMARDPLFTRVLVPVESQALSSPAEPSRLVAV